MTDATTAWSHEPAAYDCPFCRLQRGVHDDLNRAEDVVAVTDLAYARISPKWWPANPGAVLAYCRSGTRSTLLWALAEASRGGDPGVTTKDAGPGYAQGNRVISALIGSLVGSALIGWLIDRWFGTSPWGLIVLLVLGIAVAFRQIIRIGNERPE